MAIRNVFVGLVAVMVVCSTAQIRADAIVAPNFLADTEGNANNKFPFSVEDSIRYQQVFNSSHFASFGTQWITQIAFRPDAASSAFEATIKRIQINLSMTSVTADSMSSTFLDNVGIDDTEVYAEGALLLSSANTNGNEAGAKDFDIVISLTTPFLYDPSKGNLLLDVRNSEGTKTAQFDSHGVAGDPISRAFVYGSVDSLTGSTDTHGLVTQFSTTPIPEPSTLAALISMGLMGLAIAWRRRKRAA
ncbi:MAG: PEP-CTERM sorting domain-containing protein [Planctomycetes bacterium]|nr:PEP-CTERM sorting domain-containing protein [Planctomycetota bacterium]